MMGEETDIKARVKKTLATWTAIIAAIGALASAPWVLQPRAAPQDAERIRAVEVRIDGQDGRLERMERKIDLLLERK